MKTALITYIKVLSKKEILDYKRKLSYDHYFVFYGELKIDKEELSKFKRFTIIDCVKKDIPKKIDDLIEKHKNTYKILPFFVGEINAKYSIKTYNKSFDAKIDSGSFMLKHKMNKYLGDEVVRKKNIKYSYDEIQVLTYSQIKRKLGDNFILKPINGASSLLNFKISSAKQFKDAKGKLLKKYKYVVEEYLDGFLYSVDFFCNGKDIFLLCFAREIPFLELLEQLSPEYMEKYKESLQTEFLHFLPIRYTLDLSKMSQLETDFIKSIASQLIKKKYLGFIHLEYKVKRKEEKIGFIEWGARLGGRRGQFINGMHNIRVENLPKDILLEKDYSLFSQKNGLYYLKNRNIDNNYLMIYTSVLKKTYLTDILEKAPDYLNQSYGDFIKSYLWDNWKIKVKNIEFNVATSPDGYIYPFYERNDTRFNYLMEFEEESFKIFKQKKHKILEHLVFHDYKKPK